MYRLTGDVVGLAAGFHQSAAGCQDDKHDTGDDQHYYPPCVHLHQHSETELMTNCEEKHNTSCPFSFFDKN